MSSFQSIKFIYKNLTVEMFKIVKIKALSSIASMQHNLPDYLFIVIKSEYAYQQIDDIKFLQAYSDCCYPMLRFNQEYTEKNIIKGKYSMQKSKKKTPIL